MMQFIHSCGFCPNSLLPGELKEGYNILHLKQQLNKNKTNTNLQENHN